MDSRRVPAVLNCAGASDCVVDTRISGATGPGTATGIAVIESSVGAMEAEAKQRLGRRSAAASATSETGLRFMRFSLRPRGDIGTTLLSIRPDSREPTRCAIPQIRQPETADG